MKKSVIIFAVALVVSMGTTQATNQIVSSENTTHVVSKFVVNPFCASIAKGDIDTVKTLIKLGEDVNKRSNGMTPLMYAAKFNRVEILKLLIANGADLDKKSAKGLTAQKYAELSNAKAVLKTISEYETKKKTRKA